MADVSMKSAMKPDGYPGDDLPDIAIAGRSNVGKSSLINRLLERRRLARVSRTPGMTRTINFYRIDDRFYLVDLPGYGWARRSKGEREVWKEVVETYIGRRRKLMAMLVLMDIRRGPEEEEELLFEYLRQAGIRTVAVLTKCDKLSKSQRHARSEEIRARLKNAVESTVLFSSSSGEGREKLWEKILTLISEKNS